MLCPVLLLWLLLLLVLRLLAPLRLEVGRLPERLLRGGNTTTKLFGGVLLSFSSSSSQLLSYTSRGSSGARVRAREGREGRVAWHAMVETQAPAKHGSHNKSVTANSGGSK